MNKIFYTVFLIACLCLSFIAEAKSVTVDGMVFDADTKTRKAVLTKLKNNNDPKWKTEVSVPKTISADGVSCTVEVLGNGALYRCPTLKVVLPSSIKTIEALAFYECGLTSINLPSGLKTIGNEAFQHSHLEKVTIPASVTSIGDYAFSSDYFTKIAFKERTENLVFGRGVFHGSTKLGAINLPEKTTKIGDNLCYDSGVASVSIPSTLKVITSGAFELCDKLTAVTIARGELVKISSTAFKNCPSLAAVNIPEGVTVIGDDAFMATNLGSVTIPSTVTSIGAFAFYTSGLRNITFKPCASTLKIGERAFNECRNLRSAGLPEGLNSIGAYCFAATGIKSLSIPSTLAAIPENAFAGTIDLAYVTFSRGCQSIGKAAFGNSGFTTVTLPPSLQSIGELAFAYSPLQSITIPGNVTTIGVKAFYNCRNFSSVNISSSVTTIGAEAFNECPSLMHVTTGNPTPPALGAQCFDAETYAKADLIIPTGAFDRYNAAPGWKEFRLFRDAGIDDVLSDSDTSSALPCRVYSLSGALVATGGVDAADCLPAGVYIVRQGSVTRKIIKK